ncbi:hypothetical protein K461DRAFT_283071 [Myriangium duriaei CBS 260.36]|uniref:Uncharacterized protein n=1 Tax=Myriangium duriaei CBS 260.36 TaxID=1168546 RepID=A0A9P4IW32_9PEZI|nr:hypothetical protein K461DRAFT_283071 [Myriangium duriaei CBS 260.36]
MNIALSQMFAFTSFRVLKRFYLLSNRDEVAIVCESKRLQTVFFSAFPCLLDCNFQIGGHLGISGLVALGQTFRNLESVMFPGAYDVLELESVVTPLFPELTDLGLDEIVCEDPTSILEAERVSRILHRHAPQARLSLYDQTDIFGSWVRQELQRLQWNDIRFNQGV